MNTKNRTRKDSAEKTVRDIRRATRRNYSAEEKIRIVLEGLRGEDSIAELCRKESAVQEINELKFGLILTNLQLLVLHGR